MVNAREHLRSIQNFKDLVGYLENELDWPLREFGFDELTFEYQPAELGLKDEDAVKVRAVHQLRPLQHGQPWGIFFIEFEKKKLPIVVLRRILSHLVVKKRASANKTRTAAWDTTDLLFISAFGAEATNQREIAFAHFHQESGDLPTLRVLGWDGGDTPLKLDHVSATLKESLRWPDDPADYKAWRGQWSRAFRHRIGHVIRTADGLADTLASFARGIREAARTMMAHESDKGPLTKLFKAFQTALIHDLDEESFADTYAQTITYGLLTAAISRTEMSEGRHGTALIAENVADMVPITNPFLKEMLQAFLKVGGRKGGIDFDELGIQDVVELLRGEETDLPAILRDFGNRTRGEDPVVHFYEHFLSAYNKKLKIQRGVFYTPQPVVSYIVRSVHELLQTEFGLEDGLASIMTWGEMLKKHLGIKLPKIHVIKPGKPEGEDENLSPDEFFVMILDPATGTATFLVEVIDVIHRTLTAKWKKENLTDSEQQAAWNEYVPKYLLPRMYGYELMMAPYAIAHMKIGLKLFETGYRFVSNERVRIFLTNSLEPPQDFSDRLAFDAPALAHEAQAVNAIKRHKRFTIVIGNPPYSVNSANKNSPLDANLSIYKERLSDERNLKPLNDDYVKFLRCSHLMVTHAGVGLLGIITNHSYATARLFRSMRHSLLQDFQQVHFLDLRGETNRDPSMAEDRNVFDIQQGVGISVYVRSGASIGLISKVWRHELIGSREVKYSWLANHAASNTSWTTIIPRPELYSYGFVSEDIEDEYRPYLPLNLLFGMGNVGYQTHRDDFVIDVDQNELVTRMEAFKDSRGDEEYLSEKFGVRSNRDWSVLLAHKTLRKEARIHRLTQQTLYRPFDVRYIFNASYMIDYDRHDLMQHMHDRNIGLLVSKVHDEHVFTSVFVTKWIVESKVADRTRGSYLFPLRLGTSGQMRLGPQSGRHWISNIRPELLARISEGFGVKLRSDRHGNSISDVDILSYIYAVLHAPAYRNRYAEFLKSDFPRLPLTGNLELFRTLARLGGELTALHLLESRKVDQFITEFIGGRNPEVEKVSWSKNTVWVDKAQTTGFKGVREDVWHFHIGGYQVCEKWLKDRKGRTLSKDDINHYHKIVVALSETIRLMKEIDEVIDKHGGWPGAFVNGNEKFIENETDLPLAAEANAPYRRKSDDD